MKRLKNLVGKIWMFPVMTLGLYSCVSYGSQVAYPFYYYYSKAFQVAKIRVSRFDEEPGCGKIASYIVEQVFYGDKTGGKVFIRDPKDFVIDQGEYFVLVFKTENYDQFQEIFTVEEKNKLFCYLKKTPRYIDANPISLYPVIDDEYVFVTEGNPLLSEVDIEQKKIPMEFHEVRGFKIEIKVISEIMEKHN